MILELREDTVLQSIPDSQNGLEAENFRSLGGRLAESTVDLNPQ